MRRVLVPLDGSTLSESILPHARRVAGPDGEIVLMRDTTHPVYDRERGVDSESLAIAQADEYLERQAEQLRADGANVQTQTFYLRDVAMAIDEAARLCHADFIACATHGRGPLMRLVRGAAAWKALAHSTIPVLLFHPDLEPEPETPVLARRLMVPLDGSGFAEKALPLAEELGLEWNAPVHLVRIVPALPATDGLYLRGGGAGYDYAADIKEAKDYLYEMADLVRGKIFTRVRVDGVIDGLTGLARDLDITDIVLTSHGHTGLSRVILGSVADSLIHSLNLPIVVIPALAAARQPDIRKAKIREPAAPAGVS